MAYRFNPQTGQYEYWNPQNALGGIGATTQPFSGGTNFDTLAQYEQGQRSELLPMFQERLNALRSGLTSTYDKSLQDYKNATSSRRGALVNSLSDFGRKTFEMQNPGILEDLNSRGLFSSPTAVAQAQAQALKEIELANQDRLNQFDTSAQSYEDQLAAQRLKDINELDNLAATGGFQLEQQGINDAIDLRRSQLEQTLQEAQAQREEALARDLARQQRRSGLTESLIGAGTNLAGIGLMTGAFGRGGIGGVSGLFGGGSSAGPGLSGKLSLLKSGGYGDGGVGSMGGSSAALPARAGLFGQGGSLFSTAGTSAPGLGSVGGGLLGYQLGRKTFRATQDGDRGAQNVGSAIGAAGGSLFGPAGSALGSFLGAGVGKAENRLVNGVENKLGGTAGSVAKYVMPTTAIASVGNKIKKAFCFDGLTPIEMKDGSMKPICEIDLDDETRGGTVESIRIAKTEDGTMYKYKDVITTAYHAVKEGDQWVRVKDSLFGEAIPGDDTVYSIVTSDHRIFVNGIEFADEHENENYEYLTIDESLSLLNQQEKVAVN